MVIGNPFEILYQLFFILIDLGKKVWDFLFTTLFEIPAFDFFDIHFDGLDVNLFGLLITGGAIVAITFYIIKTFVPLT